MTPEIWHIHSKAALDIYFTTSFQRKRFQEVGWGPSTRAWGGTAMQAQNNVLPPPIHRPAHVPFEPTSNEYLLLRACNTLAQRPPGTTDRDTHSSERTGQHVFLPSRGFLLARRVRGENTPLLHKQPFIHMPLCRKKPVSTLSFYSPKTAPVNRGASGRMAYNATTRVSKLTAGCGSRARGAGRALLEGRRHDLLGEVQVLPEVLDALHGEVPVEELPVAMRGIVQGVRS